jgi:lipid II:glycine glycyltransferase (peptidoglycan interpeptide bridge formation enzyme)
MTERTVSGFDETAPADWDELCVAAVGGHVLQSRAWAEHRAAQGWQPLYVRFADGRAVLVLTRRQPPLPGIAAYAPRGPIEAGDGPLAAAERAIALADWLAGRGARVLAVDPELAADAGYEVALGRRGFRERDEIQASRHRMLVPLPAGTTEAELLARMTKSARQRIRAAEAAGTAIELEAGAERLPELMRLLGQAAEAKHFGVGAKAALLAWWQRAMAAGHARLLLAHDDDVVIGALLGYEHGGHLATAYSADDRAHRQRLPGTMHLLRWRLLQLALARGDAFADLGGVDVPGVRREPRPDEPTFGLYQHKRSLGAVFTPSAAAHEVVLRPWAQRLTLLAGVARRLSPRGRVGGGHD